MTDSGYPRSLAELFEKALDVRWRRNKLGESVESIAEDIGLDAELVGKLADAAGPYRALVLFRRETVAAMARDGKTDEEIAGVLEITAAYVGKLRNNSGIKYGRISKWTQEVRSEMRAKRSAGATIKQTATSYGISPTRVMQLTGKIGRREQ